MKIRKLLVLFVAVTMLLSSALSMSACGFSQRKAYNASKNAFEKTTEAYLLVNQFSKDIYEAWRMGINERSSFDDEEELEAFADELYIDYTSIRLAIGSLLGKSGYVHGDWEKLQRYCYPDSFFSACVAVVSEAYKISGKDNEIASLLNDAKDSMKTLGNKYSDYAYYPDLKDYFSNTLAFFDFCKHPEGSFEQVVQTFNNYRNNARTTFFDLNYIFDDSINGMTEWSESMED